MKVDGCIGGQGRRFASVIPRILQAGGSHENVAHCRPVDLLLANQASSTHVIVNDLQDIETVFIDFWASIDSLHNGPVIVGKKMDD